VGGRGRFPTLVTGVTDLIESYGLVVLFVIIALESGGIPLPGETSLVAAGVLASRGHFSIAAVIAVSAAAAIAGDNGGYWVGRTGGRRLLFRYALLRRYAERALPPTELFFHRHGGKAVFFGRFIAILRITAAWMAGISRMAWWRFLFWNALGGIVWAALVGLVAFYFGHAAADAIGRFGLIGAVGAILTAALGFGALHLWRRRMVEPEEGEA
jgi:membrane protein DedA with SNARE-associated domain